MANIFLFFIWQVSGNKEIGDMSLQKCKKNNTNNKTKLKKYNYRIKTVFNFGDI